MLTRMREVKFDNPALRVVVEPRLDVVDFDDLVNLRGESLHSSAPVLSILAIAVKIIGQSRGGVVGGEVGWYGGGWTLERLCSKGDSRHCEARR